AYSAAICFVSRFMQETGMAHSSGRKSHHQTATCQGGRRRNTPWARLSRKPVGAAPDERGREAARGITAGGQSVHGGESPVAISPHRACCWRRGSHATKRGLVRLSGETDKGMLLLFPRRNNSG